MLWPVLVEVLSLASLSAASSSCAVRQKLSAEVEHRLDGAGFHRRWVVGVKVTALERMLECRALLKFPIPAGAYPDLDAMRSLYGAHHARPKRPIDVEATAEASKANVLSVCSRRMMVNSFVLEENVSIPLNIRYHAARSGGGLASVSLARPTVLLRCNSGEIPRRECGGHLQELPCDCDSDEACAFLPLPDKSARDPILYAKVRGSASVSLARPTVLLRCNSGEIPRRECGGHLQELPCDCDSDEACAFLPLPDKSARDPILYAKVRGSASVSLARPTVLLRCNSGEIPRRECGGHLQELPCDCDSDEACAFLPLPDKSARDPILYAKVRGSASVSLARPTVLLRCNSGEIPRRECGGHLQELPCDCDSDEACAFLPLPDKSARDPILYAKVRGSASVSLARPTVLLRCNSGEIPRRECGGHLQELPCDCDSDEACAFLPLPDKSARDPILYAKVRGSASVSLARPTVLLRCNSGEIPRRECGGHLQELPCDCDSDEACAFLPLPDKSARDPILYAKVRGSASVSLARPTVLLRCNSGEIPRRECGGHLQELPCDCDSDEACAFLPLPDKSARDPILYAKVRGSASVSLARPTVLLRCNSGEIPRRECGGHLQELPCDCDSDEACAFLPLPDKSARDPILYAKVRGSASVSLARPTVLLRCNSGEIPRRECGGHLQELPCDCDSDEACAFLPLPDKSARDPILYAKVRGSASVSLARPTVLLRCNSGEIPRRECGGHLQELPCDCDSDEACAFLPLPDKSARDPILYAKVRGSASVSLARPTVLLRCNSGEIPRRECGGHLQELPCDCDSDEACAFLPLPDKSARDPILYAKVRGSASVSLARPTVLLRCNSGEIPRRECGGHLQELPCDCDSDEACVFLPLPDKSARDPILYAKIPVGNTDHLQVVMGLTGFAVCLCLHLAFHASLPPKAASSSTSSTSSKETKDQGTSVAKDSSHTPRRSPRKPKKE